MSRPSSIMIWTESIACLWKLDGWCVNHVAGNAAVQSSIHARKKGRLIKNVQSDSGWNGRRCWYSHDPTVFFLDISQNIQYIVNYSCVTLSLLLEVHLDPSIQMIVHLHFWPFEDFTTYNHHKPIGCLRNQSKSKGREFSANCLTGSGRSVSLTYPK